MERVRTADNGPSGLLLLYKNPGLTSFESLNGVKKALGTKKVGHTGTLDKFASGLLLVLAGRALKLTPWFSNCDKRYEGVIRLGVETDTLDPEGAPVAEAAVPSREQLEAALPRFRGDILQTPPAYSAIHIDGQRAHKLARSGVMPEMAARPVSIYSLELKAYDPPLAHITVHCSKGVYILSLARDLALAAGSRGYLVSLERTQVAGFRAADAFSPDLSGAGDSSGAGKTLAHALGPINTGVFDALGLPWITVDEAIARKMVQGRSLEALIGDGFLTGPDNPGDPEKGVALGVFRAGDGSAAGSFVAVIEKQPGARNRWSYGYVHAGA
jgi:tRNA pseudouridine55 synthase